MPLTFSPNGELLIAAHEKGAFSLYRRRDSKKLKSWAANGAKVSSITFSADNQFFAVAHHYQHEPHQHEPRAVGKGHVQVFVTASLKRHHFWGNVGEPFGLRFSPDARYLAVSNDQGLIVLYRLSGGKEKWRFLPPQLPIGLSFGTDNSAQAMAFSPDGRFFAAAAISGSLAIWRLSDGAPQAFAITEGYVSSANVNMLLFSPNGKELWSFGTEVHRWRAPWNLSLQSRRERVWHNAKGFQAASFSPDGRWLAASGPYRKLYLWRVRDAALLWPPLAKTSDKKPGAPKVNLSANTYNLAALGFTRDGALHGVHYPSRRAYLPFFTTWRGTIQNGAAWITKAKTTVTIEAESAAKPQWPLLAVWARSGLTTVQQNTPADQPVLAGVDAKRRLFVLTPADGNLHFFKPALQKNYMAPFFAFDGKTIALPTINDNQRLQHHEWNLKTRRPTRPDLFKDYWWGGLEPCLLRGKAVRVAVKDDGVAVFAERTRQQLFTFPNLGVSPAPIAVSPSGLLAVAVPSETSGYDPSGLLKMSVVVWDLSTRKKLYVISDCNQVNDIVFSPDGKRLCVGSARPPLNIYEARNGTILRSAGFYRGGVNGVAFSKDGSLLRAVSHGLYQEWRVQ